MNANFNRLAMTGAAILAAAGTWSSAAAQRVTGQTVYLSGFEQPGYKLGPVIHQDHWTVTPANTLPGAAMVQNKFFSEGAQAVLFDGAPLGCVLAEWSRPMTFVPGPSAVVDVDWDLMLTASATPAAGWQVRVFSDKGLPLVGMSVNAAADDTVFYWTPDLGIVSGGTKVLRWEWTHFQMHLDYGDRSVSFLVNGIPIEQNGDAVPVPILTPGSGLSAISIRLLGPGTDHAVLDNIQITTHTMGCYANCDGSKVEPVLNVNDFVCFQTQFAMGQTLTPAQQVTCYANCDGSTQPPILTVNDYVCYISMFSRGCM